MSIVFAPIVRFTMKELLDRPQLEVDLEELTWAILFEGLYEVANEEETDIYA